MSTKKFKVEEISTSNNESHTPVLLNFQNGILSKGTVDSIQYFETINNETKERNAVLATRSGNFYSGKIEDSSNDLTKLFIAIKNKRTNKVRVIQIDQASMINEIYKEKSTDTLNNSLDNETLNMALLIKNFGGRKTIINYERNQRMQVNVDVVKEKIDKKIEESLNDTNEDDLNEVSKKLDEKFQLIRPPFNENAKNIKDVYTITDIIPKELLDRLNDECYAILETTIEAIPIESELILDWIKKIQNSANPSSVENLLSLKICLYMDGLMNLIKTNLKSLDKIELSKITEKVENHIKQNFCDPNLKTKRKTKFSTDKALCYFITLAVLLNGNYEIELDSIIKTLSVPGKKIVKYAGLVNCQLNYGTNILRLKLPEKMQNKDLVMKRRHIKVIK